jgi:hypothetical protein
MDGRVLDEPDRLSRFLLLTFANLKSYKYYYWFAFPAFAPSELFKVVSVKHFAEVFPAISVSGCSTRVYSASLMYVSERKEFCKAVSSH